MDPEAPEFPEPDPSDPLHYDLRLRVSRCEGASAKIAAVVSVKASVSEAVEAIGKVLGSRHTRLGVVGGTQYRFPPVLYRQGGKAMTEQICKAAARATAQAGQGWSHVLMGGSWAGPQRTFAEAFEDTPTTVVHVLPNTGEAIVDLIYLLFEDAMEETKARKTSAKFVFVGETYRARNCVLAALCAHIFICGGGPGTHLEVMAARGAGTGLLPLVRSGGLAEGMDFNGRNLHGMTEALRHCPPPGVPLVPWRGMLGLPLERGSNSTSCPCLRRAPKERSKSSAELPSAADYMLEVEAAVSKLKPTSAASAPPNAWAFSAEEQKTWQETLAKLEKPTDWELHH